MLAGLAIVVAMFTLIALPASASAAAVAPVPSNKHRLAAIKADSSVTYDYTSSEEISYRTSGTKRTSAPVKRRVAACGRAC